MSLLKQVLRAGRSARRAAAQAAVKTWRVVRGRSAARRRAAAGAAVACTAVTAALAVCGRTAAPTRAAVRALGNHLWFVNIALNVWAAAWSVRFWRQADAVVLCRALPTRRGDHARTIRVARLALARAMADADELRRELAGQQRVLDAQRGYILAQGDGGAAAGHGGCAGLGKHGGAGAAGAAAAPAGMGPQPLEASEGQSPADECEVCCSRRRDTALGCGHVTCARCSVLCADCPFCRTAVTQRLRIWL